jgi:hypothetical protein
MRGLLMATALIVASNASFGGTETPERIYTWTCKATGYYGIEVTPEGLARPTAEPSVSNRVRITIRRRSKEAMEQFEYRSFGRLDTGYAIEVDAPKSLFATIPRLVDSNDSGARFDYQTNPEGKQELDEVLAVYWTDYPPRSMQTLSLHPADKDWRFSIYSGDLTTDKEARHINIAVPDAGTKPSADIWMITDPCIRNS